MDLSAFPPLSGCGAKSPSCSTLGVIFKSVWEARGQHYTYPGICVVRFACVSVLVQTPRSVYSDLRRGRERRALCKLVFWVRAVECVCLCVCVCLWVDTWVTRYSDQCVWASRIQPEALAVFVLLAAL